MLQSMGSQRVRHSLATELRTEFHIALWSTPLVPSDLVQMFSYKKRRPYIPTSLVVQWLRIHLAIQRMWIQSLVGELRSHKPWSN